MILSIKIFFFVIGSISLRSNDPTNDSTGIKLSFPCVIESLTTLKTTTPICFKYFLFNLLFSLNVIVGK
mgnify:CR=1 FL=1